MLDFIRKKKQTLIIKIVFVVIILSFVLAFALSYIEGRKSDLAYAAKVDGHKISFEEYRNSYDRLRNIYSQIYGQALTPEVEKMLGIKKAALEQLVDNYLVAKEAKRMGIKISKEELSKQIASMPVFQKDGAFSFELYQQLLKSNRMTAKDFEEGQKMEMTIAQARKSIRDKAVVSDDEALAQYKKENDKIELEYISYAPAELSGEIKLTENDLNDYLQKNQNDFKTPEKVAIAYVMVDPATQAAKLTVSSDEIQTFYQKNIDRWQGKDGILPLEKVRDRVKAEALKQKAAKQSFELAADALYKHIKSNNLKPIAAQLHLKEQTTALFTQAAVPGQLSGEAAVVKKAFELKQGELGGPVETPKGIYIIKVLERKDATVPPLKDIKTEVERRTKAAKAVELAKNKAESTAAAMKDKAPAGMASTGLFGFSAKGDIPKIGFSPNMMEDAFKLSAASPAPTTPFKIGERWYAVRLKNRVEAPKDAFEKSKEQLKQRLLPQKQQEAIMNWIKGLRAKAKIEINQALIAEK